MNTSSSSQPATTMSTGLLEVASTSTLPPPKEDDLSPLPAFHDTATDNGTGTDGGGGEDTSGSEGGLWIGVSEVPPPPPVSSTTSAPVQRVPPSDTSIQGSTGVQKEEEGENHHSNPIYVFPTIINSSTNSTTNSRTNSADTSPPLFEVPQNDLTPTGPLSHEVTVDALTLKNHLSEQRGAALNAPIGGRGSNASSASGHPPSGSEGLRALSESDSKGLQSAISSRKPLAHTANMPLMTAVDQSNEAVAQRMLLSEWCKLPPRRNLEGTPLEEDYSLASRVGIFLTSTSWMIFPLLLLNIVLDVLIVGFFTGGTPRSQDDATARSFTSFELEDSSYLFFVNTGLTLIGFVTYLPCAHFLHGYLSIPTLAVFALTAYQLVLLGMFVYARFYGVYVDGKGYSLWGGGANGDDPVVIQLIYVPYFIRLWGTQAHIKIVTSVLAWRSGLDRLKIMRDLFSVVAVFVATVFTSAGLFQIIEYTQGGVQYSMLDALYWTIVTFSTIGYGEMSPTSELGRLLVICLIFTALILVPVFINVIEYVSTMWPRFNNYVSTGRHHVVVSANITFKELRMLLDEMCFVDPYTDMVFVSSRGFSPKCYALLRDVKYRTKLTLIEGCIRDRAVMERARLTTANAAFLLSAKYSVAMRGDYATLRDSVALRNFDKKLPQYLWLKYGTHDHLLEGVFSVTHGLRYLRTFLATASVLPGVIPFVVNLVRTQGETKLLLGREKRGRVGQACAAVFGGFLQIESSSSEDESDEDSDNDNRFPKNVSPKFIKKPTVRRTYKNPAESAKASGSPSISRRSSQTSNSSSSAPSSATNSDIPNTTPTDEDNLAGSRRRKVKTLHIPTELTADIATKESVLRRAFAKKYRNDWELLYGIGRFNALLLLDCPDAYVGRPYNVCLLHAFLYSRAIIVGLIRDGKLTVNPTVDHPFNNNNNNNGGSDALGGEGEGGVSNGTFVFNETSNSRNDGTGATVVSILPGDQFLAIVPKNISWKFMDVVSEEIAECDNLLSMGGVFDMSLNQTLKREPSLWAADGGIGGGGILNPHPPQSPETPLTPHPRNSSSPLRTRAEELDVSLGQTITAAEAKLVKEEERWNRRKENKAHFLILDVPTELRDPGYTLYEKNLSERTRLWNLSLIMRSIMGVHANSKITLISPLPLSRKFYFEWNRQGFPKLDFVQGSSLNSHTVQNAISTDFNHFTRTHRTQGVIIFTSSQGARSLGDAPLYGAFTSVRKVLSNMGACPNYDTQVVMELSTFSASNLVGPFHDDLRLRRDSEEDFQMSIPFMTGKVFATDMLQPLLVQTYGNPHVSEFFASLFNLTSTRKRHMDIQKKAEREKKKRNCLKQGVNLDDDDGDAALDLACMGGATADFDRNSRPGFDSSLNSTATTAPGGDGGGGFEPARREGMNPWTKRRLRRAQMSFEELSRSTKAPLVLPAVASAVNFRVYSNRRLHFKSFGEALRHLLVSRGMLAFGIFREFPTPMEGKPRYMITNPPPFAYMMATDHIYCYVPWKPPPPTGESENSSTDAEDGTNPTDSE